MSSMTDQNHEEPGRPVTSLYVHIPYCGSACPYCDFAFVVGQDHTAGRYVEALARELTLRSEADRIGPFDTVYFGGGTPSSLDPARIEELLKVVDTVAGLQSGAEITLEADPLHTDRYGAYLDCGITRLSIGIQSFADRDLQALGRRHDARQARDAIRAARSANFQNVSIDLIFGAPEQTVEAWRTTLEAAIQLAPDHLSIYGLTIEPETPFGRRHARGRLPVVSEEDQASMFGWTQDRLTRSGYDHYEISNYALTSMQSRHNLACWRGRSYLGVGASAHSFDGTRRSWNVRDLKTYLDRIEATQDAVENFETLTTEQRQLERLMLGLRTAEGINADWSSKPATTATVAALVDRDVLEQRDGKLRLTTRGRIVADSVCEQLAGSL